MRFAIDWSFFEEVSRSQKLMVRLGWDVLGVLVLDLGCQWFGLAGETIVDNSEESVGVSVWVLE